MKLKEQDSNRMVFTSLTNKVTRDNYTETIRWRTLLQESVIPFSDVRSVVIEYENEDTITGLDFIQSIDTWTISPDIGKKLLIDSTTSEGDMLGLANNISRFIGRELGVSASYLSQIRHGKRPASESIIDCMNVEVLSSVKQIAKQDRIGLVNGDMLASYNNTYAGVVESADAADLKFYAKMSNSHFTFKIEQLCQLPKPYFKARVTFGDNQ